MIGTEQLNQVASKVVSLSFKSVFEIFTILMAVFVVTTSILYFLSRTFHVAYFLLQKLIDTLGLYQIDPHPITQDFRTISNNYLYKKSLTISLSVNNFDLLSVDKNQIMTEKGKYLEFLYSHHSFLINCKTEVLTSEDYTNKLINLLHFYRSTNPIDQFIINISLDQLGDIETILNIRKQMIDLSINYNTPIYLVIDGIESIEGMQYISDILQEDELKMILGQKKDFSLYAFYVHKIKHTINEFLDYIQYKLEYLIHYKTLNASNKNLLNLPYLFRKSVEENLRKFCSLLLAGNRSGTVAGIFFISSNKSLFIENLFFQVIAPGNSLHFTQHTKFYYVFHNLFLMIIGILLFKVLTDEFFILKSTTNQCINEIRYLSSLCDNSNANKESDINNAFKSINILYSELPSSKIIPLGLFANYYYKYKLYYALNNIYNKIIMDKIIAEYNDKIALLISGAIFINESIAFEKPLSDNEDFVNLYKYCLQIQLLEELQNDIHTLQYELNTKILKEIILKLFNINIAEIPDQIINQTINHSTINTLTPDISKIRQQFIDKLTKFTISLGSIGMLKDSLDSLYVNINLMQKSPELYKDANFIQLYDILLKIDSVFKIDNINALLSEEIIHNKDILKLYALIKNIGLLKDEYIDLTSTQILNTTSNIKRRMLDMQSGILDDFFIMQGKMIVLNPNIDLIIKLLNNMITVSPEIIDIKRVKFETSHDKSNYLWSESILSGLSDKFIKYNFYQKTNAFNIINKDFRKFFLNAIFNIYKEIIESTIHEAKIEKYSEISIEEKLANFLICTEYFASILDFIDINKIQDLQHIRLDLEDIVVKFIEELIINFLNKKMILNKKEVLNFQKYRIYKFLLSDSESSDVDILLKNLLECNSLDQLELIAKYGNQIKIESGCEFAIKLQQTFLNAADNVIKSLYKKKFYSAYPEFIKILSLYKDKFPISRNLSSEDLKDDEIDRLLILYNQHKEWLKKAYQYCADISEEWAQNICNIFIFFDWLDRSINGPMTYKAILSSNPNSSSKYLKNIEVVIKANSNHTIDLLNQSAIINNSCTSINIYIEMLNNPGGKLAIFANNNSSILLQYNGRFALMRLIESMKSSVSEQNIILDLSQNTIIDSISSKLLLYLTIQLNQNYPNFNLL